MFTNKYQTVLYYSIIWMSLLLVSGCASNGGSGDNVLKIGFSDLISMMFSSDNDEPSQTEIFHQAIADGNLDFVTEAVSNGADVNEPLEVHDGTIIYITALGEAVRFNHSEISQYLLEQGADPNYPDSFTPLGYAFNNRNFELAELLLQHNTNTEFIYPDGMNTLMVMIRLKNNEAVKLLIKYGANVEHVSDRGETPLSIAKEIENYVALELIQTRLNNCS